MPYRQLDHDHGESVLNMPEDLLDEMMEPCEGPAGQSWENVRQHDEQWGSKDTIRRLAAGMSCTTTMQPPRCAPDFILPPAMTGKPYRRFIFGADPKPTLKAKSCFSAGSF